MPLSFNENETRDTKVKTSTTVNEARVMSLLIIARGSLRARVRVDIGFNNAGNFTTIETIERIFNSAAVINFLTKPVAAGNNILNEIETAVFAKLQADGDLPAGTIS